MRWVELEAMRRKDGYVSGILIRLASTHPFAIVELVMLIPGHEHHHYSMAAQSLSCSDELWLLVHFAIRPCCHWPP